MSLLADYLRRSRERPPDEAAERVTPRRVALSAAVALLGAALVRRLRRHRDAGD